MPKILLFPEHCASAGLSQGPSNKKASYEIWNYSLGSTLQFALFKIKIGFLECDQKCLRHGHFYHSAKEVTLRKIYFLGKIN